MLAIKDETFEGLFPFAPHYYSHHGMEMHYVDEGSGEPVVMVHGDPTWGFLYRILFHHSLNAIVALCRIRWAWVSRLCRKNGHCTGSSSIGLILKPCC